MASVNEMETSIREVVLADVKALLDTLTDIGRGSDAPENWDTAADLANSAAQTLSSIADDLARLADQADDPPAEAAAQLTKAEPFEQFSGDELGTACRHCGQQIKRVPGGSGPTWVHVETGAVVCAGRRRRCPACGGHGYVEGDESGSRCTECMGTGWLPAAA